MKDRQTRSVGRKPSESRQAILKAAVGEFAREGLAGARTDAIARQAGVNKALLYYYFQDKETLYAAALDSCFADQSRHMLRVLEQDLPPRDKILHYVGEYFDFMAMHSQNRVLARREMMRAGHRSVHFRRIARRYFQPLFVRLTRLIREGVERGDFRDVDPAQVIPSIVALVVFYFAAAPMLRVVTGYDPFSQDRLLARRTAVLDFVAAALFRKQSSGETR